MIAHTFVYSLRDSIRADDGYGDTDHVGWEVNQHTLTVVVPGDTQHWADDAELFCKRYAANQANPDFKILYRSSIPINVILREAVYRL